MKPESSILQLELNTEMVHYDLGTAHVQLKEYQAAVSEFSKVLSINPKSTAAYNMLGNIYLNNLNKPDVALQYFGNSLRVNPEQPRASELRELIRKSGS